MSDTATSTVTLFLCGDVMTGRGIDQILVHPSYPQLFEPYVRSAEDYVALAERDAGPIPRRVDPAYIWGEALDELERMRPDARIINLETAVTSSDDAWPGKGIHYRMHPANVECLTAAKLDCCALANNHALDWGRSGLAETLQTLGRAQLRTAGAGRNRVEAAAPAIIDLPFDRRILVFAYATVSSGVPVEWTATERSSGVNLLDDLSPRTIDDVAQTIAACKRSGDVAVVSIHWGGNWGFEIPKAHRAFARGLVDAANVDVIHGHSSHHALAIEVYRDKLILYGCGDFIDDYEGIRGHEEFNADLRVMYFATVDVATGRLIALQMSPVTMRGFRVTRASAEMAALLKNILDREGKPFGTHTVMQSENTLALRWR